MKKIIICMIITMTITSTVSAAEVPRESAPYNATNEAIVIVESCIGDILTEVQNGMGYADARAKKSPLFKDCLWAFFVGGAICTVGHGLKAMYQGFGLSEENAGMSVSITLIFAAILLTGVVYGLVYWVIGLM